MGGGGVGVEGCVGGGGQLLISTFNGSAWPRLKAHLGATRSWVVCVQEHHLVCTGEASAWCKEHGWKSVWSEAKVGADAGSSTGGVAIMVRRSLGFLPVEVDEDDKAELDSRGVAGVVTCPGYPPTTVGSVYCYTGEVVEVAAKNLELLATMGRLLRSSGLPFVLGGDFNQSPDDLRLGDFEGMARAAIIATPSEWGTCKGSSGTQSVIDYFVVDHLSEKVVKGVYVEPGATMHPHRPVYLEFYSRRSDVQVLTFARLDPIPTVAPFGPVPPPPPWEEAARVAHDAHAVFVAAAASQDKPEFAQNMLDQVYAGWARCAEEELCGVMGLPRPGRPRRAEVRRLQWRPLDVLVREDRVAFETHSRPWKWLRDRSAQLRAVWARRADPACGEVRALLSLVTTNRPRVIYDMLPIVFLDEFVGLVRELPDRLGDGGGDVHGGDAHVGFGLALEAFDDKILEQLAESVKADDREQRQSWKNWADAALLKGAGRAHRHMKAHVAWAPTTSIALDGSVVADPCSLLQDQARLWAEV